MAVFSPSRPNGGRPVRPLLLALALLLGPYAEVVAAEEAPPPTEIILKDHRFTPAEVHVPSGKPAFLKIVNQDETAEEFEVRQLAIEKVVAGGGSVIVRIRPLGPGRYSFVGEYHEDQARGVIVADPKAD
ncbi:MAG: cupredoxin domain-containing protein [Telmatospirillum sp.]|nr:cupredoxin domain-containing protein [Telmatospirillum sp.]